MHRKLVLYFSVYGTTKAVAEAIAMQTKADLSAIEPVNPYDSNRDHYDILARRARKEYEKNMRPGIKNKIPISDYDDFFIGYPIWWYSLPMIFYTLFEKYDFSGKTIIPFNTHLGSVDGGTYDTISKLAPNANVLEGLPVEMQDAEKEVISIVQKWLEKF